VYAELGFELTPGYAAVLAALQGRAEKHETSHRYELAEFGLSADEIRARLADLFERFGWEGTPAEPRAGC
jgi:hypothetical protein